MSVLPSLPDWVQQHVRALYTAKSPADFDTAFEAFVAQDVQITFNGKHLSCEDYKKTIQGEIAGDAGGTVTFKDVVAVLAPTPRVHTEAIGTPLVGSVGAFFTADLFHRFLVLGSEQFNIVNSSLNVEVVNVPTPNLNADPRRVKVISEVLTDKPAPIILPTPGNSA